MKIKIKTTLLVAILSIGTFIGVKTLDRYVDTKIDQDIVQKSEEKNEQYNLILVSKENPVDSKYEPENLVKCNIPFIDISKEEDKYLTKEAARAIEELFLNAKEEGIEFLGTTGYRTYETQEKVFRQNVNVRGIEEANKYAAKPGESEHQTGLAIDVTNPERWFHETTKEATWLADNAHRFGFILRYLKDKEDITGYNFEPWHIRYVGKEVAEEIYTKGITLEEYLQNK